MSRKATFLFIPCCFVSGAKISSFYEFYLFLIAVFLSHCVGSLCPSSVFFFNLKYFPQTLSKAKGFSFVLFKMCLYIKDSLFVESCAFVDNWV